jgi:hypothetical protein
LNTADVVFAKRFDVAGKAGLPPKWGVDPGGAAFIVGRAVATPPRIVEQSAIGAGESQK